jgi:hypothetical protein
LDDIHPAAALYARLKEAIAKEDRREMKPGDFYHDCIFCWNKFRADAPVTTIWKFDPSKGFPTPAH